MANNSHQKHWHIGVAQRGQLTAGKAKKSAHRDTAAGSTPYVVPTLRTQYTSREQLTDYFSEWGVNDTNKRYDE